METGDDLRRLVALRIDAGEQVVEILDRRADKAEVAADLLDFWPWPRVGSWAALACEPAAAFRWGQGSPGELVILRSMLVPAGFTRLAPGLLLRLLRTTAAYTAMVAGAAAKLAGRERPGGHGLPAAALIGQSGDEVLTLPVSPVMGASWGYRVGSPPRYSQTVAIDSQLTRVRLLSLRRCRSALGKIPDLLDGRPSQEPRMVREHIALGREGEFVTKKYSLSCNRMEL